MYTFEIFRDWRGSWGWKLVASNGHIVATSGDRFRDARIARRAVHGMLAKLTEAQVIAEGEDEQESKPLTLA